MEKFEHNNIMKYARINRWDRQDIMGQVAISILDHIKCKVKRRKTELAKKCTIKEFKEWNLFMRYVLCLERTRRFLNNKDNVTINEIRERFIFELDNFWPRLYKNKKTNNFYKQMMCILIKDCSSLDEMVNKLSSLSLLIIPEKLMLDILNNHNVIYIK